MRLRGNDELISVSLFNLKTGSDSIFHQVAPQPLADNSALSSRARRGDPVLL